MSNRREFLKLSVMTALALSLPTKILAETTFDDYKAIVVIYQAGGNDGLNMFIPSSSDEKRGYPNYAKTRSNIKVADVDLNLSNYINDDGILDLSGGNPYDSNYDLSASYTKGFYKHQNLDVATNALMPEIAHLVEKGKVAIVSNMGNLIEPATKLEFENGTKTLPPFLFAHDHQTKLVMNGESAILDFTGWAGRLFDNWISVNGDSIYGVNIAITDTEHLFYGDKTEALIIPAKGPSEYSGIDREFYDRLMNPNHSNIFRKLYSNIQKHSFDMQDTINSDWNSYAPLYKSKNAYQGELFTYPSDSSLNQGIDVTTDFSLLDNLKTVARLINIGKNVGLKRQIFYVRDSGYDTHNNQSVQHARKLRGLSLAIGDFYKALEDLDLVNSVTTFNISDFGRSTGDNGDGTDHAWGGTYFVVGGAVKGGLYGEMPDLTLGCDDDISYKGRLIPTTSMTQYYATILNWFGVDSSLINTVLPELKNFEVQDLGFMQ